MPISANPLPPTSQALTAPVPASATDDLRASVSAYERTLIEQALSRHRYNQRTTAAALGLSYDQLRHAMKRLDLAAVAQG